MALPITVSPANQAFPAVTSAASVMFSTIPVAIIPADIPTDHPSGVVVDVIPATVEVNVSLDTLPDSKALDYLVMPNTQPSVVVGGDLFSPVVLQITAWPAPNKVTVAQATRGVIIPPLNENLLPSGYPSQTAAIDLSAQGPSIIGRQVLAVDRPTHLEFEPFLNIGAVPPVLVTPVTTVPARSFNEIDGATVIGLTAPNILTLSRSFNSDPSALQAWIVLDQRQGSEVQSTDYAFQGDYTPETLPVSVVSNPSFLGVAPPIVPQNDAPPTLPPSPVQAGPAILVTINPASQAPPGGLARNFYP